jgi:hypothetical protein
LKTTAAILILVAASATAALWYTPAAPDRSDVSLRIRISNSTAHLADKPDIRVYLHNGLSTPIYITTNLDPFVGGTGMFRNYYLLVSGSRGATQSTRLFLGAMQLPMEEQQMVRAGIIALIQPFQTYSGKLPVDSWAELAPGPGHYQVSAGYRGTGVGKPLQYPVLDRHLESNLVTVVIKP